VVVCRFAHATRDATVDDTAHLDRTETHKRHWLDAWKTPLTWSRLGFVPAGIHASVMRLKSGMLDLDGVGDAYSTADALARHERTLLILVHSADPPRRRRA
jgi:hypothetical protein